MRVKSDLWVSALIRRAQAGGAFATVINKGAAEAGAIFVVVNNVQGGNTLYGPAPQTDYSVDGVAERRFERLLLDVEIQEINQKISREKSFDPDIWLVEIEDRSGRTFIEEQVSQDGDML